ncbi:helix-turn-helix transcriptional regulator [Vagococcus carniphilus]|uniref:helix-turn-helix domain-containing protein n=1 Tax=Vagococcus carniphilus TaxID=218144 RepID=UPI00288F46F7|nr:helix-turn-helix transcriptional regulator [Vagococcus carniphilus]MDT2854040.1 helix-turn-helix transcriptional regulator [Vagococcus carniphilus]
MFRISLKSARVNSGMTIKESAETVGVHHQTLSKYEKDSSDISVSLLEKLCNLYQIPEDYIFLGKEYDLIRTIETERKKQEV